MKKVYALMIAACFLLSALPAMAEAAQPNFRQKLLKQSITGLQQKIFAEDSSAISAVTIQYLEELSAAASKNSTADLQLATLRYVSDLQQVQAADNASSCGIPFAISSTVAAVGMIQEVASGNSALCMAINLTNKVADIMSAKCDFDICVIDASAVPDMDARAALVTRQTGIETYDFVTNAMEVFLCIPAPSAGDYISLIFNFIGIFPKQPK